VVDFYRKTHPPERAVAVVDSDDCYVATNMSMDRDMVLPGGWTLPAAACTGGSTHPALARRGLMRATLELMTQRADDEGKAVMGGGASEWALYGRFGIGPCSWSDSVEIDVQQAGLRDDVPGGDPRVDPVDGARARELAETIYLAQCGATPGELLHPACYWDRLVGSPSYDRIESVLAMTPPGAGPRIAVAVADRGLVTYRIIPNWTPQSAPHCTLHVIDFLAADAEAAGALWRHLFSVDLVRVISAWRLPVDSPIRWWVRDARRITARRQDGLWIRRLGTRAAA
jgi:predicted acetyltransferase